MIEGSFRSTCIFVLFLFFKLIYDRIFPLPFQVVELRAHLTESISNLANITDTNHLFYEVHRLDEDKCPSTDHSMGNLRDPRSIADIDRHERVVMSMFIQAKASDTKYVGRAPLKPQ